jgi:uncharacterized protein (DUF427 family)
LLRTHLNRIARNEGPPRHESDWNGITIARSDDAIVVEGNHYFPLDNVAPRVLTRSRVKSLCPWKGLASYYHVEARGAQSPNGAWTYRHPYPWIRKIKFSGCALERDRDRARLTISPGKRIRSHSRSSAQHCDRPAPTSEVIEKVP